EVLDENGQILAGLRNPADPRTFTPIMNYMRALPPEVSAPAAPSENTVIGVVATNARLTKEEVNKVAQMAHDGLARAIRPAHTMFDGDTLFALATGEVAADVS